MEEIFGIQGKMGPQTAYFSSTTNDVYFRLKTDDFASPNPSTDDTVYNTSTGIAIGSSNWQALTTGTNGPFGANNLYFGHITGNSNVQKVVIMTQDRVGINTDGRRAHLDIQPTGTYSNLIVAAGSTGEFVVAPSGNVGIWTSAPNSNYALDVYGDARIKGTINVNLTEVNTLIVNSNLGIGTTNPAFNLDIPYGTSRTRQVTSGAGVLTGSSLTNAGGPIFAQASSWDAPAVAHTISQSAYCYGDNSSGSLHIQISNKYGFSANAKMGNMMVSWVRRYQTPVDIFIVYCHTSANFVAQPTVTVDVNNNVVVYTDNDCCITWTSIGAY